MLRELIAWVLNNYLGKYVGNLNTAQLTVALLSGEVELENLPLRPDALRNLGLPLQALSGVVGKIKLQIPVRQFRTAPWCILIENIYVIIGPVNLDEWDADSEEQAAHNYKLSCLDSLEAKWHAHREASVDNSYYASSYSGWMNYGTSLVTNIIENLELKIKNVHIRYEDSITIPNHKFACGITINSLSARSCDSNWVAGQTINWTQNTASFKLVELEEMAFYWDPLIESETFSDIISSELSTEMNNKMSLFNHNFIISPVSSQARLKRDRSETPLRTRSRPRLVCDLVLNEVILSLSDNQYNQMVECVRGLDDIAKFKRFRLLRPQHSICENPREWWFYALKCHGFYLNSSISIQEINKENRKYMEIYTKLLKNPNQVLSMEDKECKDKIEKERNFKVLKILRETCMSIIPSPETKSVTSDQSRSMLLQWFPQWWGWYNNTNPTNIEENLENIENHQNDLPKDQNQLDDELLNALAAGGSNENNSVLKRDAVFGKFMFTLKRGTLDVCSSTVAGSNSNTNFVKQMVQLQFENLILNIESRPRSSSHFVSLSLGSVLLKDQFTNNTEFPDLIKPQIKDDLSFNRVQNQRTRLNILTQQISSGATTITNSTPLTSPTTTASSLSATAAAATTSNLTNEPLFYLHYERKPLSYNTDYRLLIKTQSLDIVYNIEAIKWIIDFIIKPHQLLSTRRKIEQMKNKTKMELMKNWENILEGNVLSDRKTWTLEIDISAPQIIFVENFKIKNSTIVVIDFGRLQLTNNNQFNQFKVVRSGGGGGGAAAAGGGESTTQKHDKNVKFSNNQSSSTMQKDEFELLTEDDDDAFMTPCSTPPGSHVSTSNSPTLCSALSSELPPDIIVNNIETTLNEGTLYNRIYERYNIDLTDLQVLVCKGKERWSFASSKGSSTLHVLDRFNITLQAERRIVYTNDPQYPSFTISGTLPKLVAHVNETKIFAIRNMLNIITWNNIHSSSYRSSSENNFDDGTLDEEDSINKSVSTVNDCNEHQQQQHQHQQEEQQQQHDESSKLIILQFSIDQMSLEVQSRGRSIAELQVTGVKAGFSKRLEDTSLTLSVHGLLLVDAIQSFGPDFELLIASHRHVGMDSVSGSLKQSEPCSPNSPGSPDTLQECRPTSPHTISKALSTLQRTNSATWSIAGDVDALITIEVLFVSPECGTGENLQIANIQFNNLDIIANQETIVELITFARLVFPEQKNQNDSEELLKSELKNTVNSTDNDNSRTRSNDADNGQLIPAPIRTEITFDFHRLNVLVLRALMRDNFLVGRKVGTFTMCEARIHATIGSTTTVEGSLGGLQVLDLTPEGIAHQRILSVGKDPLTEPQNVTRDLLSSLTQEIYTMGQNTSKTNYHRHHSKVHDTDCGNGDDDYDDEDAANSIDTNDSTCQALSFRISRNLTATVDIKIRMASVWYTHCARFMQELSWCATEFKHYLKNLAKSIREKATDMAFGLVQPMVHTDNTIDINTIQTSVPDEFPYYKHKLKSGGRKRQSHKRVNILLDIVLDTPVLVLPRSSCSPQVFVAHLGKIFVTNNQNDKSQNTEKAANTENISTIINNNSKLITNKLLTLNHNIEYKDYGIEFEMDDIDEDSDNEIHIMFDKLSNDRGSTITLNADDNNIDGNLDTYSMDIRNINLYSLDTSKRKGFRLCALPRAEEFYSCQEDAIPVLHDTEIRLEITRIYENTTESNNNILQISGSVVRPLDLSLSRKQYEQLLETIDNIFKVPQDLVRPPTDVHRQHHHQQQQQPLQIDNTFVQLSDDTTEDLSDEFELHQKPIFLMDKKKSSANSIEPKVSFELPVFIIQLKNELNEPLIQIFFKDFKVNYEKNNLYETNIQISLRSILMEDLLQDENSKHRSMVVSSAAATASETQGIRSGSTFSSRSCPNLIGVHIENDGVTGSLPDNLEHSTGFINIVNPTTTYQHHQCKSHHHHQHHHHHHHFHHQKQQNQNNLLCPDTPPPSPQYRQRQDNLVLYSSLIVDPDCPNFAKQYNSLRQSSSIDFNSLDLIISVQSWFILLNFFGLLTSDTISNVPDDVNANATSTKTTIIEISDVDGSQQEQQQQYEQQLNKENSNLEISVRSLTLVFIKTDYEIAKANVSNAHIIVSKYDTVNIIEGHLGSMSLNDLTTHGCLYRERFLTSGNEALNFIYERDTSRKSVEYEKNRSLQEEAKLKIQMSSVRYVHTKRFVAEIQAFIKEFLQLQTPVMRRIKTSESKSSLQQKPLQLGLEINAGSPIILLPLSSSSDQVIVADLGEFSLKNSFHLSNETDVISIKRDENGPNEIIDVMLVDLVNTDLFAGIRLTKDDNPPDPNCINNVICMDMGSYYIMKKGANLLNNKCHLNLIVERNLDTWSSHNVPDFSVHGSLSRLEAVLDLEQYKLVRGFLLYNLGEPIDELYVEEPIINFMDSALNLLAEPTKIEDKYVWTSISITLDLQDVSVRLQSSANNVENNVSASTSQSNQMSLARINFIKSSLKIDSFSDGSQDIDLVSQEILIIDSRFSPSQPPLHKQYRSPQQQNATIPKNVFCNILQPINFKPGTDSVQAEVHSRRRKDISKYTILLNNMRLMAILDWLEIVRDFLTQNPEQPKILNLYQSLNNRMVNNNLDRNVPTASLTSPTITEESIELILNITDSELVFVEKTDQFDTNAIILKSTTVVSLRPMAVDRVMSINLNHLEVFSCVLGLEEETALSIIDPVTINLDVRKNVLDIQLQKPLSIRLSYNDVKMFMQMLESLPKQTKYAKIKSVDKQGLSTSNTTGQYDDVLITKLGGLGFSRKDCTKALLMCNNQLDDAALWLTQNAEPTKLTTYQKSNPFDIHAIELRANTISICVIDDCKDADVPLLELSLSQLDGRQELRNSITDQLIIEHMNNLSNNSMGFKAGYLRGSFASDYYNRALSGWEPLIEPWKCEAHWNYSLGSNVQQNRLYLKIMSDYLLKLNFTSTIIELYRIVHNNWIQDYYGNTVTVTGSSASTKDVLSPTGYRRRVPFVPFALKNDTGMNLWFSTLKSTPSGSNGFTTTTTTTIDTAAAATSNGRKNLQQQSIKNIDDNTRWLLVEPGSTIPFSFGAPHKQRHHDTHKLNLHQICVRIDGWSEIGPVSVDKVGVFFRHAHNEMVDFVAMPRARIVFSVTLEGSAQKLVTVRSALRLINKLDNPMLLKMEHFYGHLNIRKWPEPITAIIAANEVYSVPLSHVHSFLFLRPLASQINFIEPEQPKQQLQQNNTERFNGNDYWHNFETKSLDVISRNPISFTNSYQFIERSIHWKDIQDNVDVQQELRTCKSNREKWYRLVVSIKRDGYPIKDAAGTHLPGHSIILLPPLRLHNLLPCDLLYKLPSGTQGRVSSSDTANIYDVDLEMQIEITLTLDSYPGAGTVFVPIGHSGTIDTKLRLTDINNRALNLRANIQSIKGFGMQISISSSYWLVNRTGLPLVFRQEGVSHDSAGQFTENEQARLVSPLMFSFTDPDASPALTVRLGKRYGVSPPWSQPFNLYKQISHHQLKSGCSNETFVIGVEVRRGRGRYSKTSVVTFSPRFQLYNRSTYKLQFAQKYFAATLTDPLAKATFIEAVPSCHLPFHWPRLDKEQELCIRLPDIKDCLWSGAIPIHETQSLYINIRNINGDMYFLRVEIVLQNATYFLIFGNAQTLPPPIRIDNYSEVSMKFYQPGCKHQWRTIVRPHSSIAYAFDEPLGAQSLNIEGPGGLSHNYSLRELGQSHNLTYENFIYIAFSGTFKPIHLNSNGIVGSGSSGKDLVSDYDIDCQQLVLSVCDGRVVLTRKQTGDRSQLWRMNQDKQLEHEGSSPPTEPGKQSRSVMRYVLDLEKAPQPMQYISLVVRPANRQRKSTQTWHFTEEGRLMCEHSNMCVQARGGFFGLRPGSDAVLGMIVSDTHVITESLVPLEQAVVRHKLRPGSGFLSIAVSMDGPIKTIQIKDIKSMNSSITLDPTWKHVSHTATTTVVATQQQSSIINNYMNNNNEDQTSTTSSTTSTSNILNEFNVNLSLSKGLGLSIVSKQPCEELAFITLENILFEAIVTESIRSLDLSVGDVQIDNQLFETPCPVMLYTIKSINDDSPSGYSHQQSLRLPALQLNIKLLSSPNANAIIFEYLILSLRPMAVFLEERLILRLAAFIGLGRSQIDPATLPDESDYEAQRVATKILAANAKRYYFGDLQIVPSQIRLSVITASKLSTQLSDLKRSLGLTLLRFEDALIEFERFTDKHHFETLEVYLRAIKSHYKQELKWQAASILGSVDFLGNPIGFASDLSEGVSGLIFEGSVKSLVKNVTHGISNSTAKLTETLSDGLGRVVLDEQDTETRQRILEVVSGGANSTGDHLVAGLKGFGFGLLGGVTSIVKHTYVGASTDGIQGFISGLGKGIVGTVTKPVIGVLDLASETANAVRETSKSSNRILPERKRLPRCVSGAPGGLLPPYSFAQSKGQQHLFLINKRNFSEKFMAYEQCLYESMDSKLRLLVSSENIWVFSRTEESTTIILSYHLSEVVSCQPVTVNASTENHKSKKNQYYIELCLSIPSKSLQTIGHEVIKRPRVRCQTQEMAEKASRDINYARTVYDEREHTLDNVMES